MRSDWLVHLVIILRTDAASNYWIQLSGVFSDQGHVICPPIHTRHAYNEVQYVFT